MSRAAVPEGGRRREGGGKERRSMALSVPVNGVKENGDKEPLIELFVKVSGGAGGGTPHP